MYSRLAGPVGGWSADLLSALAGPEEEGELGVSEYCHHYRLARATAGGIADVLLRYRDSVISATKEQPRGFCQCKSNIIHGSPVV